jgi:hypothetical protein
MEHEPTTDALVGFRFKNSEIPEILGYLAGKSVGEVDVRLGQGELAFVDEMEREELGRTVSVSTARRFYGAHYRAEKHSSLDARVMNSIGKVAPDTDRVVDENGELVSVTRGFWDGEMSRIRRGESKLRWKPSSKMRDFAERFSEFMPPVEPPETSGGKKKKPQGA